MPMPVVVGSGASAAGTANTISPPYPAAYTPVATDVGVVFMETTSEVVPAATGYTALPASTVTSGTLTRLAAYWRRYDGTEGSLPPDFTLVANHKIARMIVISGCRTSGNPFEASPVSQELVNDLTVSIPGMTTTVANCLILYAFATGQDIDTTAGATSWANASLTNVLERMDNWTSQAAGGGFAVATGEKATAGATGSMTASMVSPLVANFKALMSISMVGASTAADPFTVRLPRRGPLHRR